MAVAIKPNEPSVYIDGNEVVIAALRTGDRDLLELVQEADDPAQMVETCLTVGARVLRTTQTTVNVAVVEQHFGQLEDRVEQGVNRAVELVAETAEQYLDPNTGALKVMLDELERLLDETFDPTSKQSVLTKFEAMFNDLAGKQLKFLRETIDPKDDKSPLGQLRRELLDAVEKEKKELRDAISDIAEKLAARQAGAEVMELTAIKGRPFQEGVFELVSGFVAPFGDRVNYTADIGGHSGRAGDVVVMLNPEETGGAEVSFVIEANDEKLSMRAALEKLAQAMRNRDAKLGIIVFPSQERAPTAVPFQYFDDKAIVVCEKEGADPQALRLALMWARWVLLRQPTGETADGFDAKRAEVLIAQGVRALQRMTRVKGGLTKASSEIEGVRSLTTEMAQEIEEVLDALAALVRQ